MVECMPGGLHSPQHALQALCSPLLILPARCLSPNLSPRLPEEDIEEKLAAYRADLLAKFAAAQPSKEK